MKTRQVLTPERIAELRRRVEEAAEDRPNVLMFVGDVAALLDATETLLRLEAHCCQDSPDVADLRAERDALLRRMAELEALEISRAKNEAVWKAWQALHERQVAHGVAELEAEREKIAADLANLLHGSHTAPSPERRTETTE